MSSVSKDKIPYKMLELDPYSSWLGIEIIKSTVGRVKLGMKVRSEMLNSMGKAHGGITYALADTAFGFTANTHGRFAVSIESSINHIEAIENNDYLIAECTLDKTKSNLGFHIVEITRNGDLVALFKGVVYRTQKQW
ncbi:MAG: PaaI family thioesterase [Nonlabens sp.]